MARKRGFLAEVNRQMKAAEQRNRQQNAARARAQAAAEREAHKAQREYERAVREMERATEAQRKAAEKEADRLHTEAQLAQAESLNASLAAGLDEIDGLLAATLDVDDYIDLDQLKTATVNHPPFDPGPLGTPIPVGQETVPPPRPEYVEPPTPTGISSAFGGKRRHEAAVAKAQADHEQALATWLTADNEATRQRDAHQRAEADRQEQLALARHHYDQECQAREDDARSRNAEIDQLKNNLAFDLPEAIEDYVALVLSNSIYPQSFPVTHEGTFDLASRELTLIVKAPGPDIIPAIKEYRYVKAKDEIISSPLPVKTVKDRYANAIWQVAVRSLHEVFEADRVARVKSIALTVAVDRISPATGRSETIPLVTASASRAEFDQFDLGNVVPAATLDHLGAAMSKSPYDLIPALLGGVRRRAGS